MSQLTVETKNPLLAPKSKAGDDYSAWLWYMIPLLVSFGIDFFTPQLIGWRMLPRAVLWLSDLAIMAMIVIGIARMLLLDRIPKPFLIVIAASLIGLTVAAFEGESLGIMAVGWRRLFQYPLVGLYVYLMPTWPPRSATLLLRISLIALAINTFMQIARYATGEAPSDALAGFLGVRHGVGELVIFVLIVVSLGFGKWLVYGDWHYLAASLALGAIASSLGAMKLFPVAVLLIAVVAFFVQVARGRSIARLVKLGLVLALGLAAFIQVYNAVAPDFAWGPGREFQDYLDPAVINNYFSSSKGSVYEGFRLGRIDAPLYVWENNLKSSTSFLFGKGIGSRAASATLGVSGSFKTTSLYSGSAGKSLTVFIAETGLVGLLTLAFFFLAIIVALFRNVGRMDGTDMAAIQYGLLLFTVMWPLWLWYQPVWVSAIPMLLYWMMLGFALNPENNRAAQEALGEGDGAG